MGLGLASGTNVWVNDSLYDDCRTAVIAENAATRLRAEYPSKQFRVRMYYVIDPFQNNPVKPGNPGSDPDP